MQDVPLDQVLDHGHESGRLRKSEIDVGRHGMAVRDQLHVIGTGESGDLQSFL